MIRGGPERETRQTGLSEQPRFYLHFHLPLVGDGLLPAGEVDDAHDLIAIADDAQR